MPKVLDENRQLCVALLGAIEMLERIARQEMFTAIEYSGRLARYKAVLLDAEPKWKDDAYYGQFFQ